VQVAECSEKPFLLLSGGFSCLFLVLTRQKKRVLQVFSFSCFSHWQALSCYVAFFVLSILGKELLHVAKVSFTSLPDVLDARDVASALGIGYTKALKLIRYGGMNFIQLGRVYRVSKQNFADWLNCTQPRVIDLD
jgi:excisionase family DNA binding protein